MHVSETKSKQKISTGPDSLIPGRTKPLFIYPAPETLRNVIHQARIDCLRVYGTVDDPYEDIMNPLDIAVKTLHSIAEDDEETLQSMMEQVAVERKAAIERVKNGEPHPMRMDELGSMTPTECMRTMGGLYFWSIELEEALAYCLLDAGALIAHLYGGMDGEADSPQ